MKWIWAVLALMLSAFTVHAQWADPVVIDSPYDTLGININQKEWCPFITADGQHLYFASERRWNNDLYVCHWDSTHWSRPQMIPFCSPDGDERNPSVNPTNDTLYFISYGGVGGWDIFWSFRNGPCDTCWGAPERMPEPINSNGVEFSVWATPDNQRLLFSSWRIAANNEDIYECRRDASTPTGWSDPQPLVGRITTWDVESYPSMGLDTTKLYFWGRNNRLCISYLSDSGWTRGDWLPANINRVIISWPSETTPCITADGHRLYFSSSWGDPVTSGAIWYSEPISSVPSQNTRSEVRLISVSSYPNPFNAATTISFTLPKTGNVDLNVYDVNGRLMRCLAGGCNPPLQAGTHDIAFDGSRLSSGIYFVRLEAGKLSQTKKIVLLK